jgi:tRNA(Ile2) C34 agmatinyltransferase TiaS
MARPIDSQCEICGARFDSGGRYNDVSCPECGTLHYYEEGQHVQLSKAQVAVLRKYRSEWEKLEP